MKYSYRPRAFGEKYVQELVHLPAGGDLILNNVAVVDREHHFLLHVREEKGDVVHVLHQLHSVALYHVALPRGRLVLVRAWRNAAQYEVNGVRRVVVAHVARVCTRLNGSADRSPSRPVCRFPLFV